jgi:hypothetical protein
MIQQCGDSNDYLSWDEVLEQALLVREHYCRMVLRMAVSIHEEEEEQQQQHQVEEPIESSPPETKELAVLDLLNFSFSSSSGMPMELQNHPYQYPARDDKQVKVESASSSTSEVGYLLASASTSSLEERTFVRVLFQSCLSFLWWLLVTIPLWIVRSGSIGLVVVWTLWNLLLLLVTDDDSSGATSSLLLGFATATEPYYHSNAPGIL